MKSADKRWPITWEGWSKQAQRKRNWDWGAWITHSFRDSSGEETTWERTSARLSCRI